MSQLDSDPVVRGIRDRINAIDTSIVESVNRRLDLVSELRDYKTSQGYDLVDQAREDSLVASLTEASAGPLSSEGLRELYALLLDLTKREVALRPPSEDADH